MKQETLLYALIAIVVFSGCGKDNELAEESVSDPTQNREIQKIMEPTETEKSNDDSTVVYMLPKTASIELTTEQRGYVAQSNEFAFTLYRSINKNETLRDKSNITSPLSLGFVLGMLGDGAQGQTLDEIRSLLEFGKADMMEINNFFKTIIEESPNIDESVTLKITNMVAYDNEVMMEEAYIQDMQTFYHAETPMLDFGDKPIAAKYINDWSYEKTEGMIPKVINEENISENTILALLNAICFKATWTNKFDISNTKSESFSSSKGLSNLLMMHNKAMINYAQNEIYTMVDLPYGSGDKWSMKVLLPNKGKTVNDVVNSLSQTNWQDACKHLMPTIVDLKLPRFKIETNIELNDILAALGAPTMFDPQNADFSLISKNFKKSDDKQLWVSLVKQVAAAEVNEEGTKLAAVSIELMEGTSVAPVPDTADFHANRPFVYIIQEASSGAIFFIGAYQGE